ncbi:pro-sigmaK processing inhibitor BofA family protein [Paenibacillus sp. IB182496]|uniref:Pro-sigmaK processing inhibitor BofA family protein n=1 Tax=Paenibacillus sabuli TaxID=2772509 RepID=A0A927GRG4_9BACL|nr:pro-sigmaK processing inhibitor BofA family protein [Paenibacillus sabuli]MBD2845609.1 pro-sigmaK processing inhibitor BofA family protein [Paenibacillus sabuli]
MGWGVLLVASSLLLLIVLLRNRASRAVLKHFVLHLVLAAVLLYVLNYSGWIEGYAIPLNPVTLGTVVLLGAPGIALLLGLQWTVL